MLYVQQTVATHTNSEICMWVIMKSTAHAIKNNCMYPKGKSIHSNGIWILLSTNAYTQRKHTSTFRNHMNTFRTRMNTFTKHKYIQKSQQFIRKAQACIQKAHEYIYKVYECI